MVAGFHLIWTLYGWWLPNDPRGSSSHEIRVDKIAELGDHHYGRKEIQPMPKVLREFYERARAVLKHRLLTLDEQGIEITGQALGHVIRERKYTCYACAIMPDHLHVLIRKHRDRAELMIEQFQDASRAALIESGNREESHPVGAAQAGRFFSTRKRTSSAS